MILSLKQKAEILAKLDKGLSGNHLANEYNVAKSTISYIKNNRYNILHTIANHVDSQISNDAEMNEKSLSPTNNNMKKGKMNLLHVSSRIKCGRETSNSSQSSQSIDDGSDSCLDGSELNEDIQMDGSNLSLHQNCSECESVVTTESYDGSTLDKDNKMGDQTSSTSQIDSGSEVDYSNDSSYNEMDTISSENESGYKNEYEVESHSNESESCCGSEKDKRDEMVKRDATKAQHFSENDSIESYNGSLLDEASEITGQSSSTSQIDCDSETDSIITDNDENGYIWSNHRTNNNVAYEFYNDPNKLCDRLRLLITSRGTGNSNHAQEIISLISELRESGYIK